jgi:uncharacterized short protein YbdD (DUF466 family)
MTDIEKAIDEAKAAVLPFESWERLSGESSAAFAAFCAFRDFGPERNIKKAVEEFCGADTDRGKVGKRYRMWRSWSMQFHWMRRADDYDNYLDKMRQAERRKTIEAQEEAHRQITGKMLQVVSKKLDLMSPAELKQETVTDWVETAIKTEREIAGLAGAEKSGKPGGGQLEIKFTPEFEGL